MSIVAVYIADKTGVKAYVSLVPALDNVIASLLSNIDLEVDHKKSFTESSKTRGYNVQYEVDDTLCFLSASKDGFPQRVCFALLHQLKSDWHDHLHSKSKSSVQTYIKEQMEYFSSDPEADKIRALFSQIDDITLIMHENMESLLSRQERTTNIIDKTDTLQVKSQEFEKAAEEVRCKMCWEYWCTICTCCGLLNCFCGCCKNMFCCRPY